MKYFLIFLNLVALGISFAPAQISLTERQAIELALKSHPAIEAAGHSVRQQEFLKNAGAAWEPSHLFHNIAADPELGMFGVSSIGIQQNFPSGKRTRANQHLHANRQAQAEAQQSIIRQGVVKQVREIYHHLSYLDGRTALYHRLDSVYQRVAQAAAIRYQAGDISLAEKLALQNKAAQIRLDASTVSHEIEFDRIVLGHILGLGEPVLPIVERLHEGGFSLADTSLLRTSALAKFGRSAVEVARSEQELAEAQYSPTASAGLFGQYLGNGNIYPGWQVGLSVPLFRKSLQAQAQAAQANVYAAGAAYHQTLLQQQTELGHLLHEQEKYQILLKYYASEGRALAAELLRMSELNYLHGEIGYADFAQLLEQAENIELQYLENLLGLNQTIIELEALTGQ